MLQLNSSPGNHMREHIASIIFALVASTTVSADEGDFYVDAAITPRVSWLDHPEVKASPFSPQSAFGLTPSLSLSARYGVTNALHLGLGIETAGSTGLAARGVVRGGSTGDILTATYFELAAPASVGWRFDSLSNLTAALELDAGPLLVLWGANAFADPTDLDENGLPRTFPGTISDSWHLGGRVSARALLEARLWDVVVLAIGPTVSVSWADTVAVSAGLVLRPSFVFGFGPL